MTRNLKLGLIRNASIVLASAAAAAALAGCGLAPGHAASAASPPAGTGSRAPSAPPATAAPVSSAGPAPAAGAANLVAGSGLKTVLTAAYAAMKKLPASEVTGPVPGSLYYGVDRATGTYWAIARFDLTPAAPQQAAIGMQDGGNIGVFSRRAGQAWTVREGGVPFPCPGQLPASMLAVWHLGNARSCSVLTATSPARSQASAASGSLPAGTYFGVVRSEQVQADGSGSLEFEPETWQGTAAPVSHLRLSWPLSIGPSAAASFWAGTSAAGSHEVSGTFSLDFARRIQDAMQPFASQPYSGYEVTVSVPAGCSGQCAQVTSIAQMSSLTPHGPDADFTEPKG